MTKDELEETLVAFYMFRDVMVKLTLYQIPKQAP